MQAAFQQGLLMEEGRFTGVASFGLISGSWTDHRPDLVPAAPGGPAHFRLQIELEMPLIGIALAGQQHMGISGVVAESRVRVN